MPNYELPHPLRNAETSDLYFRRAGLLLYLKSIVVIGKPKVSLFVGTGFILSAGLITIELVRRGNYSARDYSFLKLMR